MSRLLLLFSLLLLAALAHGDELKPFTTDGCSAFPEGTWSQNQLWLQCCTNHDLAYWQGGTYEQRVAADSTLRECVAAVGEPQIAALMLAGVRVGGAPWWPTSFRWGYGWPYPRGYGELSADEQAQVARLIPAAAVQRTLAASTQP